MSNCIVCKSKNYINIYSRLKKCHIFSNVIYKIQVLNDKFKLMDDNNYFFGNKYINYINKRIIIKKKSKLEIKKNLENCENQHKLNLFKFDNGIR